jgi:hypothetical protein
LLENKRNLKTRQIRAGIYDIRGCCNLKLGYDLGADLQQGFGVPAAAPDICA